MDIYFKDNFYFYFKKNEENPQTIADICGVSKATVYYWLNGEKTPRMDKVAILAKHFGIQVSDLINEKPLYDTHMAEIQIIFDKLNEEGQTKLLEYANMLKNCGYKK